MSNSLLPVSLSRTSSDFLSDEAVTNRAVLAVAAVAGVIFGDGLLMMGLVGLGGISLLFIWPVALGVLAVAAIVAGVAYAALRSSKGEEIQVGEIDPPLDTSYEEIQMDEIDPPLKTPYKDLNKVRSSLGEFVDIKKSPAPGRSEWITERQGVFLERAIDAEKCFREDGQIDDNAVKYLVLSLSIFYSRSCNLRVSEDKPFDEFDYCQKLNDDNPNLYIRTVCIDPQQGPLKYFKWLRGMCTGNRVCLEPHASAYLWQDGKKGEYFDPKLIPLHGGLTETKGSGSVSPVKSLIDGNITEYRNLEGSPPQVQSMFDPITCGIHVCRRIEQYFKTTENEFLPVLTEKGLKEVRQDFADLIRTQIIQPFEFVWKDPLMEEAGENAVIRSVLFDFDDTLYDKLYPPSAPEEANLIAASPVLL